MDEATRKQIQDRRPEGWYGLASPPGWDQIVSDLFHKLVEVDPDLEIYQIKEKFGQLRFYSSAKGDYALKLIRTAEEFSEVTCQKCGTDGELRNIGGWLATLCNACYHNQGE